MVETRRNYNEAQVDAARSVLLEVAHILSHYRQGIVLVGGWVPDLLFPGGMSHHIGSIDVNLALDHRTLKEAGYRSIMELLLSRGYIQGEQPFVFFRDVTIGNQVIRVQVDFLAGEYAGSGKSHRTQRVQDMQPRKARGCDLAFETPVEVSLQGVLPNGAIDTVSVRVASIVPFLVMKGFALGNRLKEKDGYDIYYAIKYYPGGPNALIQAFVPYLRNRLVHESLAIIAEKYASPEHIGPRLAVDFEELADPAERATLQRDAYEQVQYLLDHLAKLGK
jgi:hypothetical protein